MKESVSSCGSVTALSTVIPLESHPINTDAGHVAWCDLICVGMCSRVLVCHLGLDNKVVAVCDEAMPLGLRVHGITWQQCGPSEALIFIHGGRCMAVLKLCGRKDEGSIGWRWDIVKVAETFVGKWILDVSVCTVSDDCGGAVENTISSSVYVISVGMIDNAVAVFQWKSGTSGLNSIIPHVRVPGDWMRCILYSMSLFSQITYNNSGRRGRYVCKVAAGTILWDVAVWSFECDIAQSHHHGSILVDPLYSIVSQNVFSSAHKGSIHSVRWSRDGLWLASGSDDRVVKVWNMSTRSLHVQLLGHSSRIWCLLFGIHDEDDTLCVLSGAEDGSVWYWEVEQHTFQGDGVVSRCSCYKPHEFRGVWHIQMYGKGVLITGGADGSIKLWSLFDALGVSYGGGGEHSMASYCIPDLFEYTQNDRVETMRNMIAHLEASTSARGEMNALPDSVQALLNANDVKKKKALSSGRFEGIKNVRFVLQGSFIIISTDAGRILGMPVPKFQDTNECCVAWDDERVDVLYQQSGASGRPITALRTLDISHKTYVSCCNVDGQVHILELLSLNGTLTVGPVLGLDVQSHLEGRPVDAFLLPGYDMDIFVIVTTTSGSFVVLKVKQKADDRSMVSYFLGMAQCPNSSRVTAVAQYKPQREMETIILNNDNIDVLLALGSGKGGLSMWTVDSQCRLTHIGAQKTAHGTTAVQCISISTITACLYLIQTGGSNSCIQNYILRDPGSGGVRLERKNEVRFDSIKTICSTFGSTPVRNNKLITGFFTTDFIVWDTEMDSKICSIQAAGWKRPWEFHMDAVHGRLMFCYSAGLSDLHFYQQKYTLAGPKVNSNLPRSLLMGGHGREINSIVNVGCGLFLTAGEDATLRTFTEISGVFSSHLISTQPIGTSARVLRCTDIGDHKLIVSGGAKTVMTAWTVSIGDSTRDPRSMLMNYSTFQNSKYAKANRVDAALFGDLRIITLSLIPSKCHDAEAFIFISMSNGEMELRYIPSQNPRNFLIHDWPLLAMLQSCNCPPVLSLENDGAWVYGGNTNGDLMVWNVAESLNLVSSASPVVIVVEPIWVARSFHKCGVNALGVIRCSSITKRIIVSGGDDQDIGVIYFDMDTKKSLWSATFENAHASSVRDLSVCGSNHVCSIGLDQYLRIWKISEPKDPDNKTCTISEVASTLLQVLEPVSVSKSSSTRVPNMYSMAVAGRGIEAFSIHIDEP